MNVLTIKPNSLLALATDTQNPDQSCRDFVIFKGYLNINPSWVCINLCVIPPSSHLNAVISAINNQHSPRKVNRHSARSAEFSWTRPFRSEAASRPAIRTEHLSPIHRGSKPLYISSLHYKAGLVDDPLQYYYDLVKTSALKCEHHPSLHIDHRNLKLDKSTTKSET